MMMYSLPSLFFFSFLPVWNKMFQLIQSVFQFHSYTFVYINRSSLIQNRNVCIWIQFIGVFADLCESINELIKDTILLRNRCCWVLLYYINDFIHNGYIVDTWPEYCSHWKLHTCIPHAIENEDCLHMRNIILELDQGR